MPIPLAPNFISIQRYCIEGFNFYHQYLSWNWHQNCRELFQSGPINTSYLPDLPHWPQAIKPDNLSPSSPLHSFCFRLLTRSGMGVFTFTEEYTSPIPPARLFKAPIVDSHNHIPKLMPQVKSIDIIQGDVGAGSIRQINFTEGNNFFQYLFLD